MRPYLFLVFTLLLALTSARAEDVTFEITQTTVPGQSVFVLGDIEQLGADDVRFAVKLAPTSYPTWRATIAIPANTTYTYRYYLRNDGPGQTSDPANGTPLTAPVTASTSTIAPDPAHKIIILDTTLNQPRLRWRQPPGSGSFTTSGMYIIGPGLSPGETRWASPAVGEAGQPIEYSFVETGGPGTVPSGGTFTTELDRMLVRQESIFTYEPEPTIDTARKDYTDAFPSAAPTIFSTVLGETRRYRVFLPRGYAQHPERSYPVLYMHDGLNIFEPGTFGDWLADETSRELMRTGVMRETIIVGVDQTDRFRDYIAPDDNLLGTQGAADNYTAFIVSELKPLIDAQYRTLPSDTGSLGSSLGGIVSLYQGWDHTSTFTRIGAFSGSWWLPNFPNRVKSQSKRAIRLYMDVGDSGNSNDGYTDSYSLRDNLAGRTNVADRFTIEGDLRFQVGYGQQHNELAWAARLPDALAFLYPVTEEPDQLGHINLARRGDVDDDGDEDLEDIYAFEQATGPNLDVDREGTPSTSADRTLLRDLVRGGEIGDVTGR
jgi:predicted alpha/beta superfamily hydrolase